MTFHICSNIYVPFSWLTSGGSEEFHTALGEYLAARGHVVHSYAPLPESSAPGVYNAVEWHDISEIDRNAPGIWIIQRDPTLAVEWPKRPDQVLAFAAHDMDYAKDWTEPFDVILADSEYHAQYLRGMHNHPNVIGSGVAPQFRRITEVPKDLPRNPKRIMWSSSYTRGLECLLSIYERALDQVPDLELYVSYGWESIDSRKNPFLEQFKERMNKQFERLKVHHLGRLPSSADVWTEYSKSGLWVFPTTFAETACQTIMEAQAFGAIPIWNPLWGTIENGRHGKPVYGDPTDQLVRARFVQEVVNMATNPELQEQIRAEMIPDALATFSFSAVVDRIEAATLAVLAKERSEAAA